MIDRKLAYVVLLFVLVGGGFTATDLVVAQAPAPVAPAVTAAPAVTGQAAPAASPAANSSYSFFEILFAGGPIGITIMLFLIALSLASVALAIEHAFTIRQAVLMPPQLAERVRDALANGNLRAADEACQAEPSFLAFVLRTGMGEVAGGWSAVEKAMEDATAEQAARLFRKIEFLSVIANIAPMVGLLGTVTGMVFAFREVAESQGAARAVDLAQGIYLALVTTVVGLIIAIPSLGAFAIYRNRVDGLVAEAAYQALHAIAPLKRSRQARGEPLPPPPAPPPVEGGR